MKITLKEWRTIEAAIAKLKQAAVDAWHRAGELSIDHTRAGNNDEGVFLMNLGEKLAAIMEDVPAPSLYHPQSEWMGGDSDNPNNHKLREPNIVPAPRRKFTAEEVKEAGLECIGPVQWRKVEPPETPPV